CAVGADPGAADVVGDRGRAGGAIAMSKLTAKVTDLGFALGWWLTPLVPAGMARTVFNVAGEFAAARGMNRRGGVAQLRRNLQRVVPQAGSAELDELTRQAMKSYARYWREVFQLPSWN